MQTQEGLRMAWMDIDKVLLTNKEITELSKTWEVHHPEDETKPPHFHDIYGLPNPNKVAKFAQLKLLKVLEDAKELIHEYEGSTFGEIIHSPDCWLCKIKKELGG